MGILSLRASWKKVSAHARPGREAIERDTVLRELRRLSKRAS
jgi:hypothetical protein